MNHARKWVEDLSKKFPDREYKATVTDINGRAVFIPRFIHPLPLPPLVTTVMDGTTTTDTGGNNQKQCVNIENFQKKLHFSIEYFL